MEHFKDIPEFQGYKISDRGTVLRSRQFVGTGWAITETWKPLKHRINPQCGHHAVVLYFYGKPKSRLVHRMVLELFGPQRPEGKTLALHRNDDPDDNRVENLYWGTSKENRADAMRSGKAFMPPNPKTILNEAQVRAIRAEPQTYGYRIRLAKQHGVSVAAIKDVIRRRSWAHV